MAKVANNSSTESGLYGEASTEGELSGEISTEDVKYQKIRNISERYAITNSKSRPLIKQYTPDELDRFEDSKQKVQSLIWFDNMDGVKVANYAATVGRRITEQKIFFYRFLLE